MLSRLHPLCWYACLQVSCETLPNLFFMFTLETSIVLGGLKLPMPRRGVAMAIDHTLSLVIAWLRSGVCPVVRELSMGSVQELLTLLTSYLGSKMNMLSQQDLQHLSVLTLKVCGHLYPSVGVSVM